MPVRRGSRWLITTPLFRIDQFATIFLKKTASGRLFSLHMYFVHHFQAMRAPIRAIPERISVIAHPGSARRAAAASERYWLGSISQ